MVSLYCLLLEGGRYYVGKSNNVEVRLEDHLHHEGSEWTILHKPVSVCEIRHDCDDWDEDKFVKQMMALHGVDKVRGGSYSQSVLPQFVKDLLVREIRGATNRCFRCGASDHFSSSCDVASVSSTRASSTIASFRSQTRRQRVNHKQHIVCFKCNCRGHYANECPVREPVHLLHPPLQHPSPPPRPENPARNVVCFTCNRRGHYASVCPERFNIRCYRCGVRGHYASRCPVESVLIVFRR